MKAKERRQAILERLEKTQVPISAGYLAKELGVSRQIIVGDIALLRAENHDIMATHRGYLLAERLQVPKSFYHGKLVCKHGPKEVRLELETIVKNGGKILTDGIHLHTLSCRDKETFEKITEALEQEHIIFNN